MANNAYIFYAYMIITSCRKIVKKKKCPENAKLVVRIAKCTYEQWLHRKPSSKKTQYYNDDNENDIYCTSLPLCLQTLHIFPLLSSLFLNQLSFFFCCLYADTLHEFTIEVSIIQLRNFIETHGTKRCAQHKSRTISTYMQIQIGKSAIVFFAFTNYM